MEERKRNREPQGNTDLQGRFERLLDESRRLRAELERLIGRTEAGEVRGYLRRQSGSSFAWPAGHSDPDA